MVDFYISKVSIYNFRGIKELELDVPPDQNLLIIGPNNSGKSTLTDAIGLCLNSAKYHQYSIQENDFWKSADGKIAEEFIIELMFSPLNGGNLPAVKGGLGDPEYVTGIKTTGTLNEYSVTRRLQNNEGKELLINKGTPISEKKKGEFKGTGLGGGKRYATLKDIYQWLPDVWNIDPKNLFNSLYVWKSGPLQLLLKEYKHKLLSEEWETDDPKRKMPEVLLEAYSFIKDKALKTPFWQNELSPKLSAKFIEYLGSNTYCELLPGLNSVDEWILSEFMLSISPGKELAPVDSKRLGDGWQSLLRLGALEVVMEILHEKENKIILLVEEPETYLHPHLRRKLRAIFSNIQKKHHQIFITTHSEDMVSFNDSQKIVRLIRTKGGTNKREFSTNFSGEALKMEEKLHEKGNHEIVFANMVILTEGKGDQIALKIGLEKIGFDCDAESLSIIDCGGVGNLPDYADICSALGIPWLCIHDNDIEAGGKRKKTTQDVSDKLGALKKATDEIEVWDNTLEEVLKYPFAKVAPEWVVKNFDGKKWADIKANNDLKKYVAVLEKVEKWVMK